MANFDFVNHPIHLQFQENESKGYLLQKRVFRNRMGKNLLENKRKPATMRLVVQIASHHFRNSHFPLVIRSVRTFPQQNCTCRNRSFSKLLLKSRMEQWVDSRKILFKSDCCCFAVSIGNGSYRAKKRFHSLWNSKWQSYQSAGNNSRINMYCFVLYCFLLLIC